MKFKLPAGVKLKGAIQYPNPKDWYLWVLLCRVEQGGMYGKGEWVTWAYNSQAKGCFHGHYFGSETEEKNKADAYRDFMDRAVKFQGYLSEHRTEDVADDDDHTKV